MMTMKHWTWFLTLLPMKNKAEHYKKLADYTAGHVVSTSQSWTAFLDTMSLNRKCSVEELLLIHLQRPGARNCKSYLEWFRAGSHVKRGALGIAVPDQAEPSQIRYLFGASDTAENRPSWQLRRKDLSEAASAVACSFAIRDTSCFPSLVERTVSTLIDTYWNDHEQEILNRIMECWKGQDPYAAKLQFLDASFYGACYIVLKRSGMDPLSVYETREFTCARNFCSPDALAVLGECILAAGNQILDVIETSALEKTTQKQITSKAEGVPSPSALLKSNPIRKEKEAR